MALAYPPNYPSYEPYDPLNRLTRRQSLGYPGQAMSYPGHYDQNQMYGDQQLFPTMSTMGGMEYPQQSSYPMYSATAPLPVTRGMSSYDDLGIRDGYYDGRMGPNPMATPMTAPMTAPLTAAPLTAPLNTAPMTPMIRPRHRRHSTVSFSNNLQYIDGHRTSSVNIKFKRKGAFTAGITLTEAQGHIRLSSSDSYTVHDLHADRRGTVLLKVKWQGYPSLMYEVPLDTYDGRVSLQTLARRVSRACVHYFQSHLVPIPFDRLELHHLEEQSYGVWQAMLAMR